MRIVVLVMMTLATIAVAAGGIAMTGLGQYACAMGGAYMPGQESLIEGCTPYYAIALLGGPIVALVSVAGAVVGWIVALSRAGWRFMVYSAAPLYALAAGVAALGIAALIELSQFQV